MKILVLQLARLGDIYQTWPVMHAIRRAHPDCELHLLVRNRFKVATDGLGAVDKVKLLDTKEMLRPIYGFKPDVDRSLDCVDEFVADLSRENYDKIINLSFSPVSSYIVSAAASDSCQVTGYTRFSDGYLSIPDDASAYFYAQVGVGRHNRAHLTDIFGAVAGVEVEPGDWCVPYLDEYATNVCVSAYGLQDREYIVLHVGASQQHKSYGAFKWRQVLSGLRRRWQGMIVLVGAAEEESVSREILEPIGADGVIDLVGKTSLNDLFPIVSRSQLVVGCDSVVMQMASLVSQPCLNLSFSTVNFWETGPRAEGSRILWAESPETLPSDRVVTEALNMINCEASSDPIILRQSSETSGYRVEGYQDDLFAWDLVQALYMEGDFPVVTDEITYMGMQKLRDLVDLALQQFSSVTRKDSQKINVQILEHVDSLLVSVERMVPKLQPLISWFQVERLRIGPGSFEEIYQSTEALFQKLQSILALYVGTVSEPQTNLTQGGQNANHDLVE